MSEDNEFPTIMEEIQFQAQGGRRFLWPSFDLSLKCIEELAKLGYLFSNGTISW